MLPSTSAVPRSEPPGAGLPSTCRDCPTREHCLPAGLDPAELRSFEHTVARRQHLKRHERLYRRGTPLEHVFIVASGQIKAERPMPDGRPQVLGFYLPGQLLGLDALASHSYRCDAVALCDSTVCAISYAMLTSLIQQRSTLLLRFHALFGTELARQQNNMLLLGNAKAPQRLAAFLMDLATSHHAPAPPAPAFELRMSRDDIASHLGLALESVSRQLTQFRAAGLLEVQNRRIELLDADALQAIAISS
ncbi:CRP/FNR family transcriptional regulator, anaerobic regulatory protein [Duganella sp. CF517]|nr:CRP/FNR family transcriptional regulator, anaerobic regulatory protein [Duganella sp. CF517]